MRAPVAEYDLELKDHRSRVVVRMFAPEQISSGDWQCRYSIGRPLEYDGDAMGGSSLQALFLCLVSLSSGLYGDQSRNGDIGFNGKFGGYLGIPAPKNFQDIAPYPFLDVEPTTQSRTSLRTARPALIAEQVFELTDRSEKVGVRVFAPQETGAGVWTCPFEIDPPVGGSGAREAASSLQALAQALQAVSSRLYGSDLYRQGKLCASLDKTHDLGPYERYLWIPAPHGDPELELFAF